MGLGICCIYFYPIFRGSPFPQAPFVEVPLYNIISTPTARIVCLAWLVNRNVYKLRLLVGRVIALIYPIIC